MQRTYLRFRSVDQKTRALQSERVVVLRRDGHQLNRAIAATKTVGASYDIRLSVEKRPCTGAVVTAQFSSICMGVASLLSHHNVCDAIVKKLSERNRAEMNDP